MLNNSDQVGTLSLSGTALDYRILSDRSSRCHLDALDERMHPTDVLRSHTLIQCLRDVPVLGMYTTRVRQQIRQRFVPRSMGMAVSKGARSPASGYWSARDVRSSRRERNPSTTWDIATTLRWYVELLWTWA